MFEDRHLAGRQLAIGLLQFQRNNPLVFALGPGGVPVGFEVARILNVPMDILPTQTLPQHEGSEQVIPYEVWNMLKDAQNKLDAFDRIRNRCVILVDDGLSNLDHLQEAIRFLSDFTPQCIILAVPVCFQPHCDVLEDVLQEIVCLEKSEIPDQEVYINSNTVSIDDIVYYITESRKVPHEIR